MDSVTQLDVSTPSANFAGGNQGDRRNQRDIFNNSNNYNNSGRNGGYRGRNRGRNGGRWNNNSRPVCQVCGKVGHIAMNCYHRFDRNYQNNTQNGGMFTRTPNQYQSHQNQNQSNEVPALTNSPHQANYHQSTAYYATPETVGDPAWYADSGATNHVTPQLSNLSIHSDYQGYDKLAVGNGQQLHISHTGKTFISAKNSSKALLLDHILCVPSIAKNLLSISKFTQDNHAYAEFTANTCVIKEMSTKEVLLQGKLENGLYKLEFGRIRGRSTDQKKEDRSLNVFSVDKNNSENNGAKTHCTAAGNNS